MKNLIVGFLVAAAVVVGVSEWGGFNEPAHADVVEGEELSFYMDHMRRLTHKLGLSIDAKNADLAAFYAHEVTEVAELIQAKFPQYDGFQIAALIPSMLSPHVTALTKTIESNDWGAISSRYDNMLTAGCNGCHAATQHSFVKIVRSKTNPYNQEFKP